MQWEPSSDTCRQSSRPTGNLAAAQEDARWMRWQEHLTVMTCGKSVFNKSPVSPQTLDLLCPMNIRQHFPSGLNTLQMNHWELYRCPMLFYHCIQPYLADMFWFQRIWHRRGKLQLQLLCSAFIGSFINNYAKFFFAVLLPHVLNAWMHMPARLCLWPSAFQVEFLPLMGLLGIKNVKEAPSSKTSHALQ